MTVIRWIEEGKIPAFKTVGGHRRIMRADLDAFCRARAIPFEPDSESPARILIVDADVDARDRLADAARAVDTALTIELAADAFEAGLLVQRFRPNLVFLDSRLPGVDTLDVCARLSREVDPTASPVVVITGPAAADAERAYRARGALGCVPKPVDPARVDRVIRDALGLPSGATPHETVLLVEPEGEFRDLLSAAFAERWPAVRVIVCDSAIDAMLAIGAERPRLVLVDAALGGADVARKVRSRIAETQVVVTATPSFEGLGDEAREAGAAAYLEKPFAPEALARFLGAVALGSTLPVVTAKGTSPPPRRK
jgi:excisionase family DNA binding protein